MSAGPSRRAYAASVSTGITAILFLGAVVLFVVFGVGHGISGAEAFGNPFREAVQPGASEGTARVAAVRVPYPARPGLAAPLVAAPAATPAPRRKSAAPAPTHAASGTRAALNTARWLAAEKQWGEAVRNYDRMLADRPGDAALRIERARVIAWSGDNRGAAAALEPVLAGAAATAELRLEQARYLWWAGDALAADSALALLPRGTLPAADSLRALVRGSVIPPSEVAAQWLRDRSGPDDHLRLARAYTRERRSSVAVYHYRRALVGLPDTDSLALEVAGAALAADSLDLAADALERLLALRPGDDEVRLRLARIHSWAGRFESARALYEELLPRNPGALFELAQVEAWHGSRQRAEELLARFLAAQQGSAPALKLLGDLARWRGDWQEATRLYERAASLDPGTEGVAEGLAAAESLRLAAAAAPPARSRWLGDVHGFGDSEGFRWLSSRVTHRRAAARGAVGVTVLQDRWDGAGPGGAAAPGAGYGFELSAERELGRGWGTRGALGGSSTGDGVEYLTYAAELLHAARDATAISVRFARQPAGHRAATAAALQAETESDLLQLTLSRPSGRWHLWSQLDADRLTSSLGETTRTAGTLALSYDLGAGWSALASVGALTTSGGAPILPGWGPLYWTPVSYVAPSAGVAHRADLGGGFHLRTRVAPAYAWVREREGEERRFAADRAAVLTGGAEAGYARGSWQVDASAEWSAAGDAGYRASGVRLRAHYVPGSRP